MKYFLTSALVLFCFLTASAQFKTQEQIDAENQLDWHTNMMEAQQLSKTSHKPIFAFFTGSDWCGWCMRLQKDVFSKPDFVAWARKNVILLELDFPRKKQLSADLAQQNNSLQQALQITGYPTVWLMYVEKNDSTNNYNLNTLGSLGYPRSEQGKESQTFLDQANKILGAAVKPN